MSLIADTTSLGLTLLNFRAYPLTLVQNTVTALAQGNIAAASLEAAAGVATFTAAATHRLLDKMFVSISGATEPEFNGRFQINVTSTTVFTYTLIEDPGDGAATGAPVAAVRCQAQSVLLHSLSTNGSDIIIGPDANCDFYTLSPGDNYPLEAPKGAKFDLARFHAKSAGVNQVLKVLLI